MLSNALWGNLRFAKLQNASTIDADPDFFPSISAIQKAGLYLTMLLNINNPENP